MPASDTQRLLREALVQRHNTDQRIKISFPSVPLGDPMVILRQIMDSVCHAPSEAETHADVDSPVR